MRRDKKGMTMALGVIIAIVVLIVVALAVIAVTSGSLSRFSGNTDRQQSVAAMQARCESWFAQWCISHPGEDGPTDAEWPTYSATVGGASEDFKCNDLEMLGTTRKCPGSGMGPN